MKALLVLALLASALGGCTSYFGGGDDDGDGGDIVIPPDGRIDYPDSGGVCPADKPADGSQCSFHQSGLSCWYDVECYCGSVGPSDYAWDCQVLYDGGV